MARSKILFFPFWFGEILCVHGVHLDHMHVDIVTRSIAIIMIKKRKSSKFYDILFLD